MYSCIVPVAYSAGNVVPIRRFGLEVRFSVRLQTVAIFYSQLWNLSCFVGLAIMLILTPVPAWVATLTNTVQKEKMKATDARVQTVTESTSFCSPTLHQCHLTDHVLRSYFK
jgi:hypothetical protein